MVASLGLAVGLPSVGLGDLDGEWQLLPRPSGRYFHASAFDPVQDRVILFGGTGEDYLSLNDVWSVSLAGEPSWAEITPAGASPSPRNGHSMIYDPVGRRMIVFGGNTIPVAPASIPYPLAGDVWALSLDPQPVWTRIEPAAGPAPSPRMGHAAIHDPVRGRMVIFGGTNSTGSQLNDTWALTLSGTPMWTQLASCPTAQATPIGMFEPTRDRMIVLGGMRADGNQDLWELALSGSFSWSPRSDGPAPPLTFRADPTAILDELGNRVVVFGGRVSPSNTPTDEVWAYSLVGTSAWALITPPGPAPSEKTLLSSIYDPVRRRLVTSSWGEVWALTLGDGGGWSPLIQAAVQPAYRRGHAAFHDPPARRLVLVGGEGIPASDAVWALPLEGPPAWTRLQTSNHPGSAYGPLTVHDTRRRRILRHAGNPAQVWSLSLDALSWTQVAPVSPLPNTWNFHPGIYDPIRDRLIVFGGYQVVGDVHNSVTYYYRDVWALSLSGSPTWTKLATTGEPPPHLIRASSIYDPVRDRMLIFGGDAGRGRTWSLALSGTPEWTLLAEPSSGSLARYYHTAIYDPLRDRMVVFGGIENSGTRKNDAWELSLSGVPSWRLLVPVGVPPGERFDHAAAYDPWNDRLIVNGGYFTRSTWALTWGDVPTSIAISSHEPVPGVESIALGWTVQGTGAKAVRIYRRQESTEWSLVAAVTTDGEGRLTYEDRNVSGGSRYGYRIGILEGADEVLGGEVWATALEPFTLSIAGARPNPSIGVPSIEFSLPLAEAAQLELFDVSGRLVWSREVGSFGPGRHSISIPGRLAAGVYHARLRQSQAGRSSRVVVIH